MSRSMGVANENAAPKGDAPKTHIYPSKIQKRKAAAVAIDESNASFYEEAIGQGPSSSPSATGTSLTIERATTIVVNIKNSVHQELSYKVKEDVGREAAFRAYLLDKENGPKKKRGPLPSHLGCADIRGANRNKFIEGGGVVRAHDPVQRKAQQDRLGNTPKINKGMPPGTPRNEWSTAESATLVKLVETNAGAFQGTTAVWPLIPEALQAEGRRMGFAWALRTQHSVAQHFRKAMKKANQ